MVTVKMAPVIISRLTPKMLFGLNGGLGITVCLRSIYQLDGKEMSAPINTCVIQRGNLPERFHYTNQVAVVTYSNEEEIDANS